MTAIITVCLLLTGALIGAAIRHFTPMHRHKYEGWRFDSHLTVRDIFGSRYHYEIWASACTECGMPKRKRIKI